MTECINEIFIIGQQKVLEDFHPEKKYLIKLIIELSFIYLLIMSITIGTVAAGFLA